MPEGSCRKIAEKGGKTTKETKDKAAAVVEKLLVSKHGYDSD